MSLRFNVVYVHLEIGMLKKLGDDIQKANKEAS